MSVFEKIFIPDSGNGDAHPNIAVKFRAYRMEVESRERKLKEAEILIEQLKDETVISRNSEKNLRSQISSAQNRLICMEKALIKFVNVSNQQRKNEKIAQRLEQKLQEINEILNKTREENENVFQHVSKEMDLSKQIKTLKVNLDKKTSECDLMKMETQALSKEKLNLEMEFQQKMKNLQDELEKSMKKEGEALTQYRETLLFYKQQIEEYEQKIERYEKERKSFLEDFEIPKTSTTNFTTNSTVGEERLTRICKIQELEETDSQIFHCSSLPGKPKVTKYKKKKEQTFHKITTKQKLQLEFLTQPPQNSSPIVNTAEGGQKRRLFSTNCNHYAD